MRPFDSDEETICRLCEKGRDTDFSRERRNAFWAAQVMVALPKAVEQIRTKKRYVSRLLEAARTTVRSHA